jgi:hypothetical protein
MDRFFTPAALPAIAAIFFLGALAGRSIVGAFQLFFWNEKRVKTIAAQVVDIALKSEAFEHLVEKIVAASFTGRVEADNAFRAQLGANVRELQKRADEQSKSIVEAHRRIDTILERMFGAVSDRAREVAAALGIAGEVKR